MAVGAARANESTYWINLLVGMPLSMWCLSVRPERL